MKVRNYARFVALLLAAVMVCIVFAGCKRAGTDTDTSAPTEQTTLMPGYIDDDGTQAETEASSDTQDNAVQFNPDGPVKGENNNYMTNTQGEQTKDDVSSDTKPADKTQAQTEASSQSTSETQKPSADKTEASEAEPTQATEATEKATDTTEAPTQKATEATEPTEKADVTEPAEPTQKPASEPDFVLPELPDADIIGPKPPVKPEDILPPEVTTPTQESSAQSTEYTHTEDSAYTEATQSPTQTEAVTAPVDYSGRLEFTYYGRYSGKFVEDGTDEYVQNVAILLVTNISEEYLEYAVATFDIDGEAAAFIATGLAPGESAWVLEKNRLQVETGAIFTHVDDIASFTAYTSPADTGVAVATGDGQLTVKNNTGKDLDNVYVYYKQVHSDGNFLGGITYRVPMGTLVDGEEATSVAMHCSVENCRIVSITYSEEG